MVWFIGIFLQGSLSETFHKCWEGRGGDITTPDASVAASCKGASFVVGVVAPAALFNELVMAPAGGAACHACHSGDSACSPVCSADEALIGARRLLMALLVRDLVAVMQENQVEALVRRIANVIPLLSRSD